MVSKKGRGKQATKFVNKKQKKDSNKTTVSKRFKEMQIRRKSPMEKARILSTMKSKAQEVGGNVRSGEEMIAATEGLDTLTSKGPGKLKLALRGGGRAYGKNS